MKTSSRPLSVKRLLELLALLTIGDSVLGLVDMRRHVSLWRKGPEPWQNTIDVFLERPAMTRALCVGGLAFGLWLAGSQKPD